MLGKLHTAARVLTEHGTSGVWALADLRIREALHYLPGGLVRVGTQKFRPSDAVTRDFLLRGDYELPELHAAKRFIRPDIAVIEFGASIGVVSCAINRRLQNPGRHVAVEANPEVLPVLRENRDLNHCRFEILPGAAGASGDSINFFIGGDTLCSSAFSETPRAVTVPVVTLSAITTARGFDRCAVVCDIEGAEIELIRQEMPVFRSKVACFIVEFHPGINGPAAVEAARQSLTAHEFELLWYEAGVCVYRNRALS